MTTAILAYHKTQKRVQNKIESMVLPKANWKLISLVSFSVMALALFFYVYQIYNLTRGYYLVNSYESQLENLVKENKNLEVSFAENSLLEEMLSDAMEMNFQRTSSVKYVQVLNNNFAVVK